MMSCNDCKSKIKANSISVECIDCKTKYHGTCVNIGKQDVEFMKQENQGWRCGSCQRDRRKSMALQSAVDEGAVSLADIVKVLNDMRGENREMEVNLGKSVESCHSQLVELTDKLKSQQDTLNKCCEKIEAYATEIKNLKTKNKELEARLVESEQYSRSNTLEIYGIPLSNPENPIEVVRSVGAALGQNIDASMIDACHRLRKAPGAAGPPGLIVKFVRRSDKEELLKKRRIKRDFTTRHINLPVDTPIYINESLCPGRRMVFAAARELKRNKGYKYLWIRGGKILMRRTDGEPVQVLTTLEQVNSLK